MKHYIPALFALFIFSLVISTGARASSDKIDIRYGFSHWPPYAISEAQPYSGIDWDVMQELAALLNLNLIVRRCSFKRCLAEAEAGGIDLMSGLAINEERQKYLNYIQPHYSTVNVAFFVRKGERESFKTYNDLYKLKVGSVAKSEYFDPFNTDLKINKYEASEEGILFKMLANKRLDTIIGTNPNLSYQALMQGLQDVFEEAEYSPNKSVPVYFSFSKKSKKLHLIEKFEQAMRSLADNGVLERIHSKYK